MNGLVDRAVMLERRTRTAMFGHAFERGVTEFSALLSTLADTSPSEMAPGDVDRVFELADGVIQSIESRLESQRDAQATQLRLAESVYRIRAELEQLSHWRQHFGV